MTSQTFASEPSSRCRRARAPNAGVLVVALALAFVGCSDEPSVRVINGATDSAEVEEAGGSPNDGTGGVAVGAEPARPVDLSGTGAPPPDDALPDVLPVELPPGSRAALYVGTVGEATATVVADDAGRLIGLIDPAAPRVLIGSETGSVQFHAHDAGVPLPIGGIWPFGSKATPAEGSLALAEGSAPVDGIAGTVDGDDVSFRRDTAAFAVPSAERLAGRWRAQLPLCDSDGRDCATVALEIAFSQDAFVGRGTVSSALGDELFASSLDGTLEPRGAFALASFLFSTYRYDGALHLLPGELDRLLLLGHTDRVLADHPTFAAVFTRIAP